MNEANGDSREATDALLADVIAERMDEAEFHKKSLELKRKYLQSRLELLIRYLEDCQLENAADADTDRPLKKDLGSANRTQIAELLKELGDEWSDKGVDVVETSRKLEAVETRIKSLEAIMPGNENLN